MTWQLLSWVAQGKHKLCLEEEDGAGLGLRAAAAGSARGAIALLYAEVPTHAQTRFPPRTISTRRESAKGARCALAQIQRVALLAKEDSQTFKASVTSALQTI